MNDPLVEMRMLFPSGENFKPVQTVSFSTKIRPFIDESINRLIHLYHQGIWTKRRALCRTTSNRTIWRSRCWFPPRKSTRRGRMRQRDGRSSASNPNLRRGAYDLHRNGTNKMHNNILHRKVKGLTLCIGRGTYSLHRKCLGLTECIELSPTKCIEEAGH